LQKRCMSEEILLVLFTFYEVFTECLLCPDSAKPWNSEVNWPSVHPGGTS
jgi:hypothetical protein